MITKILILLVPIVLLFTGCADVEEDLDCIVNAGDRWEDCIVTPTPSPVPMATFTVAPTATNRPNATPAPTAIRTPTKAPNLGGNPACSGVMDSRAHLLWKPVSDNRPSAVIVFDGKYKKVFNKVEVELKTGSFVAANNGNLELWGNPTAEGPRQHYRFLSPEVKCGQVKDKALIRADDGYQKCVFQLPGDACKRYE